MNDLNRLFVEITNLGGIPAAWLFFFASPFTLPYKRIKKILWLFYLIFFSIAFLYPKQFLDQKVYKFFLPGVFVFGALTFFNLFSQLKIKNKFLRFFLFTILTLFILLPLINKLYLDQKFSDLIQRPQTSFVKMPDRLIYFKEDYKTERFRKEAFEIINLRHQIGYLHPENFNLPGSITYRFSLPHKVTYASIQTLTYLYGEGNYIKIFASDDNKNFQEIIKLQGSQIPHYFPLKLDISDKVINKKEIYLRIELYADIKNNNPSYSHIEFFKFESL
ncbi:MAG: hypothetical protein M1514_01160 [Patescibacteria group bacterium]|nr:hypothetical protein [Patescibacteria group bacterium]